MKRDNLRDRFLARMALALGILAALWALPLAAQPASPGATPKFPADLDRDGDGFYDRLETALGSDPANKASTPESHALADGDNNGVADVCEDSVDNDADGKTDSDDPGCEVLLVSADFGPGLDIFNSKSTIEAGALGNGVPPQRLQLQGPVVVRRGESDGGKLPVEMEAMQLTGALGGSTAALIEDPQRHSSGTVVAPAGDKSGSGEFSMNTLVVIDGKVFRHEPITVRNPSIDNLPPVQDSRKIDPSKCYQWQGGLHCPEVPRLRIPVLKYVAKFDCGEQPSTPPPFLGSVKPGDYATKIVIHNPQGVPVKLKKKVSVGERNPKTGPISKFQSPTLPPDGTTEVDCPDIFGLLGKTIVKGEPLPFLNGVVVILSQKKLDVIANYTQEVPKEKVDFVIVPPPNAPPNLKALANRRLKLVRLVTEDVIIDEEKEVRTALSLQFPPALVQRTRVTIVGDSVGVGSGIDVEEIRPQHCILVDPPELPDGQLECEVPAP
ncbi:MAG TPA: hypothetical protein VGX68_24385 [Thermoanaerobaculia bacterium]|jgi:hypothetical protein|nr:hypothetical protein [Thermoanaerobaculia bacterium]